MIKVLSYHHAYKQLQQRPGEDTPDPSHNQTTTSTSTASHMEQELKLFRTWSSRFALRIVWALDIKGVPYETVFEDITNKSESLLQYNPIYKKVPVLLHNGKPIVESLIILEYIEETWKQGPSLWPQDPYQKSKARFWAKFGDDKVLPSIWSAFMKQGKEQEEAIPAVLENLRFLEEEIKGKKFFGGDEIGMTDLALGWLANLISVLEEVAGVKFIDDEMLPSLVTWIRDFSDAEIIKKSWPPRDKLIIKFSNMREAHLSKPK